MRREPSLSRRQARSARPQARDPRKAARRQLERLASKYRHQLVELEASLQPTAAVVAPLLERFDRSDAIPRLLELPANHRGAVGDCLGAIATYDRDNSVTEDPGLRRWPMQPPPQTKDSHRFIDYAEAAFKVAASCDETDEPVLAAAMRERARWLCLKAGDLDAALQVRKQSKRPGAKLGSTTPMIVALAYSLCGVPKRWELVAELARDFADESEANEEKPRKRVVAYVDRRIKQKAKALKWYEAHRELRFSPDLETQVRLIREDLVLLRAPLP